MKKVNIFVILQILAASFIQISICVRWYPTVYTPWWVRKNSDSLKCPHPRGQYNHPRYCDKFLNCWDNVAVEGQCSGRLLFNENISACDYPHNVNCGDREISESSNGPMDPRCKQPFGIFPNSRNCSEYFSCQSGNATVKECPEKTYYNSMLGVCTYERDPACIDNGINHVPGSTDSSRPIPAGTPTLPPKPSELPFEPKPQLIPEHSSSSPETTTNRPQHPIRPKPPLEPGSIDQPGETSPDASTSRPQELEPSPVTPTTTNLKPKPPLKPEGASPSENTPISEIVEGVPEQPMPSVPPLNHGSFKPPNMYVPGPPNVGPGPSTTPQPDGVDDPHILFPFLPRFPDMFRCPISTIILPIVSDCETVIVCLNGAAHHFRCQAGHTYDLQKRRCSAEKNSACGPPQNKQQPDVLYSYLPLSQVQKNLENSKRNYK